MADLAQPRKRAALDHGLAGVELDGGRFIGTACLVTTRDPDEGWVNFGAYRGMVHDEKSMGLYISPGKHGSIQRAKYFERGKPCPVAAV